MEIFPPKCYTFTRIQIQGSALNRKDAHIIMFNKEILFDGSGFDKWEKRGGGQVGWTIEDGVMTVVPGSGDIVLKETYGDCLLHVEFRTPYMPEEHGQGRGNSGVYIHGRYELQVLDSFGADPIRIDDCGSIYSLVLANGNACLAPEVWQSYDIMFRAPRFDGDGAMTECARVSILQNGLPIHNNVELPRCTPGGLSDTPAATGSLILQDHGNKVSFRNIWIIRL